MQRLRPSRLVLFVLVVCLLASVSCQRDEEQTLVAEQPTTTAANAEVTETRQPNQSPVTPTSTQTRTQTPATAIPATEEAEVALARPIPIEDETPTPQPENPTSEEGSEVEGALISVSMESQVGVVLDEIPQADRERIVEELAEEPDSFWLGRAQRQVRMSKLRLNFRNFVYEDKGQLPLPPPELWTITLDGDGPSRQQVNGHDVLALGYTFSSTLLTDAASPGRVEPALARVGGVWEEPFIFPIDPDFLLQRTGNACVNEGGYPPDSYDSQNIWHFYDYTCAADSTGVLGCHRSVVPNFSCEQALETFVGEVETVIRFERLAWDEDLAAASEMGAVTVEDAPDLAVVEEELAINRIVYDWFEADDCALQEGAVGDSGWRRLLKFAATVHNLSGAALHVGAVTAQDLERHAFEYSPCHDHYHYSHYGNFYLDSPDDTSFSKRAFCVQSTTRPSNNTLSPLDHDYSCSFQGVQAGWADEYIAGLDTQWIDITGLNLGDEGRQETLAFLSNPDGFLCEGELIRDENGEIVWEPSGLTTEDGEPILRPACDFIPDWDENNLGQHELVIPPEGSYVTAECTEGEFGPLRNCGFTAQTEDEPAMCEVGEPVELALSIEEPDEAQVLRVCEWSDALGTGTACNYTDAVANAIIGEPTTVQFSCPRIRDSDEGEGGYSLYIAPLWPEDDLQELISEGEDGA